MNLKLIEKLSKVFQNNKGETYTVSTGRQIMTNMETNPYEIKSVKEIIDNKGRILKTQCLVNHSGLGNLLVNENFKKLNERINKEKEEKLVIVKGFRQNGNR